MLVGLSKLIRFPPISLLIDSQFISFRTFLWFSFLFQNYSSSLNFTFRQNVLPFISNKTLSLSRLWMRVVFSIIIMSTGTNLSVDIVTTPNILAINEILLCYSRYLMKSSSKLRITCFSLPWRVLITNRLSLEKKKKEPLIPAPSPALKMFFWFFSRSNDAKI